jgi:putative Mg2+ transporter-C (MgtC) family protein
MVLAWEDLLKLLLAVVFGGMIGVEREYHNKAAGFRTNIFICLGAAIFTIISTKLGGPSDPVRITAQIVTGIGFIGAGVIMREAGHIVGLTTASTIWLVAGLGVAVGGGQYLFALAGTLLALAVLWAFPSLENIIDHLNHFSMYELTVANNDALYVDLRSQFRENGLRIINSKRTRTGDKVTIFLGVIGSPKAHELIIQELIHDQDVLDFKV